MRPAAARQAAPGSLIFLPTQEHSLFYLLRSLVAIIKLILPTVSTNTATSTRLHRPTSDRSSSSTTIPTSNHGVISIPMSTPQDSATHRTYPLSPSPNSELRKSTQPLSASFGAPRTPQSPLNGTSQPQTSALPTAQLHSMHDMNSHSITGTEARTTSPLTMDVNMNGHNDDGTLKRKYEFGDSGEHKDKKLHVAGRKPSISDLHIDVGKIYQLCRTRKYPYFSSRGCSAGACASGVYPLLCMNYG